MQRCQCKELIEQKQLGLKDLFGILVFVKVIVVNHVILMKTVNIEKD